MMNTSPNSIKLGMLVIAMGIASAASSVMYSSGATAADYTLMQKTLLNGAIFLIENVFSLSVATTIILLFCGLTRLFTSDTDTVVTPKEGMAISGAGGGGGGVRRGEEIEEEPRPRWEVLRVLNYFVIGLFVTSITYVVFNYRGRNEGNELGGHLITILVIWTSCMAYFFGFFGISFLDKNALMRSPSSFGLSELDQQLARQQQQQQQQQLQVVHSNANAMCAKEIPTTAKAVPPTAPSAAALSNKQQPLAPVPEGEDYMDMTDEEVIACVNSGKLKDHQLETKLGDCHRAVVIRRRMFEKKTGTSFDQLPHEGFDYEKIFGANCEIVCGYVPIPVGIVGPLMLNGKEVYVPMATTEGCLIASTNRGCKAITQGGGANAIVLKDGITRAPCLRMPDCMQAAELKMWVEDEDNFELVRQAFESTTSFGKLLQCIGTVAGRNVYLRFVCFSGDAMGMNMVSKGCLAVVDLLEQNFPKMELIAISGNMCTDKKPAAINWIEGRGKSVVCEARIPAKYVESTLKTTVDSMVATNIQKNLIGSAMAGALGGFNAHASNIVTAVFLATGQDPAQNVESSNCITIMEKMDNGDLLVSVNMPSIEVGTVGGGTAMPAQAACLDMVGCRGASKPPLAPGDNAKQMALAVAAAVLAGELSLIAALASNQLVRAHMIHNRKK